MEKLKQLWKKHKELILYVFFGGCTTLINIISYFACRELMHLPVVPADVLAWLVSVIFAYVTNKLFVFESKSWRLMLVLKEGAAFLAARVFSLGVDVAMLYVTVTVLGWWELPMKILANVVVIVINYIFSKWIIFRKDAAKQQKRMRA